MNYVKLCIGMSYVKLCRNTFFSMTHGVYYVMLCHALSYHIILFQLLGYIKTCWCVCACVRCRFAGGMSIPEGIPLHLQQPIRWILPKSYVLRPSMLNWYHAEALLQTVSALYAHVRQR